MTKVDVYDVGKMVGIRFFVFRKAIKRSRPQLAEELGIETSKIADMEKGKESPEIENLYYLNVNYALNINWMLGRDEKMFVDSDKIPKELDPEFVQKPPAANGGPRSDSYAELIEMMQIPAIEKIIFETLKELVGTLSKT